MALRRARMLFGVLMSAGGILVIYAGEECGDLNDHSYLKDPHHRDDARWVHRIPMTWAADGTAESSELGDRLRSLLDELISARKSTPAFAGTEIDVLLTPSPHLLAYWRRAGEESVLVVANFSEQPVPVLGGLFGVLEPIGTLNDRLSGGQLSEDTLLEPYALHWCVPIKQS